jgi:hypothetical protein
MFTTIKRKLATIIRRKKKGSHPYALQVKDQPQIRHRISSSTSSDQHLGIVNYSPRPWIAANYPYRAIGSRENYQISALDLGGERHESRSTSSAAASSTPSATIQSQPESDPEAESSATPESETVGPLIVRFKGKLHQALLLTTTKMSEWIQDIARIRQELREVDRSIAELTGQANDIRVAKEKLDNRTVPGAFPGAKDGGDPARAQLMMPALRRRLEICERSLADLNDRRQKMLADIGVLQQKVLESLGAA